MKINTNRSVFSHRPLLQRALPTALLLTLLSPPAIADGVAINRVKGGIRGIDNGTLKNGDGNNDAMVRIRVRQLQLIKQARTLNGQILTDKDAVARGQRIWFVFIIENDVESSLEDIRLLDEMLNSEFEYIDGSLQQVRVDNNATTYNSGIDDAFWKAGWNNLSDGKDSDIVSVLEISSNGVGGKAIHVGGENNSELLSIPAKTTWVLRFQVKVKGSGR